MRVLIINFPPPPLRGIYPLPSLSPRPFLSFLSVPSCLSYPFRLSCPLLVQMSLICPKVLCFVQKEEKRFKPLYFERFFEKGIICRLNWDNWFTGVFCPQKTRFWGILAFSPLSLMYVFTTQSLGKIWSIDLVNRGITNFFAKIFVLAKILVISIL